jgi:hypothetical protein
MPEPKLPPDDSFFRPMLGRDPIVAISPPQWVICGSVNIGVAAGNEGVYLAVQPSRPPGISEPGPMVAWLTVEEARQLASLLSSALEPEQK